MKYKKIFILILSLKPLLAFSNDPFEEINRGIYSFNDSVDQNFAKPIAEFYDETIPLPIQIGVSNFFNNLEEIDNSLNQLLQGKPGKALNDFSRFCINTTIGLVGLFDVASKIGLERHDEDFGQTLGTWGVPSGPYLVIPFYGPSSPRDLVGAPISSVLTGTLSIERDDARLGLTALDALETRARLLDVESLIVGDKYIFIRDSYLQVTEFEVEDGELTEDDFVDDMEDFLLEDEDL